jgi:hypothetical protein
MEDELLLSDDDDEWSSLNGSEESSARSIEWSPPRESNWRFPDESVGLANWPVNVEDLVSEDLGGGTQCRESHYDIDVAIFLEPVSVLSA